MAHQFNVYIDESGDEGFAFDEFPKGSSKWLVLSALIVQKDHDVALRNAAAELRDRCGFQPKHVLHFADLSHERRTFITKEIASLPVCAANVIIQKQEIAQPDIFKAAAFRLYFYAVRLLLERVSWYCRDRARELRLEGCEARLTFEHRRRMSYESLKDYLNLLKGRPDDDPWLQLLLKDVSIHWPSIDVDGLKAVQKYQSAGLQLADTVASGIRWALEPHYGGHTEHRFAKTLKPVLYCYKGRYQSYGLKFFPKGLPDDDDRKHWVRKHYK